MEILKLRLVTRAALLAAWDESLPYGGVFVPTTRPLEPGSPVVVELHGHAVPETTLLRASVVSARASVPRKGGRGGVVAAFDASEQEAVFYLLRSLRGEAPQVRRRRAPRLPVSLEASYHHVGQVESRVASVVDISTGGLSLRVAEPLPLASQLVVELPVPGTLTSLAVEGEVIFASEPADRVGVRFTWRGVGGVRRVREAMRRLRAS